MDRTGGDSDRFMKGGVEVNYVCYEDWKNRGQVRETWL